MDSFAASSIVQIIQNFELFSNVSISIIKKMVNESEIIFLNSGNTLINQNTLDSPMYLLIYGRLRVVREEMGEEIFLGEITAGEAVGEIAFFANIPRYATVVAVRDCVLLKLSKKSMLSCDDYHSVMVNIARLCVDRLQNKSLNKIYHQKTKTLVIFPAGQTLMLSHFVNKLIAEISKFGTVYHLNRQKFDSLQIPENSIDNNKKLSQLLVEYEMKYNYVIYETDTHLSEWTKCCFRHADRILAVAQDGYSTALNEIEHYLLSINKPTPIVEMAITHTTTASEQYHAISWLKNRKLDGHYNLIKNSDCDIARVARCITGNNFCLVLNGGGARGLAHVGVLRACHELGIPIDIIGGTSIGAIIAGVYAKYPDYYTVYNILEEAFCRSSSLMNFTFPIHSILSGKNVHKLLKTHMGESTLIEDLKLRFFCAATNISTSKLEVFDKGLLWKACRASFSLPVIFPPVINDAGHILVDGVILNNLPVDIMHQLSKGGKIIASQVIQSKKIHKFDLSDGFVSGWKLLINKYFHKKYNLPSINFIFNKALLLSSNYHQERMAAEADFCINLNVKGVGLLEFNALKKIAEAGYQAAMEACSKFFVP